MFIKICNKVLKILFIFLCVVILVGMGMLTIRNYTMQRVEAVAIEEKGIISKQEYLTGTLKLEQVIEIKATQKMRVKSIDVKNSQIVKENSPIITFDISNLKNRLDSSTLDMSSRLKGLEIDRLNLDSQLADTNKLVEDKKTAYDKALAAYNDSEIMYNNNIITKKELDNKKELADEYYASYEEAIQALEAYKVIYNANITKLELEIKSINTEMSERAEEDLENKMYIDRDGVYKIPNRVYIEYITDKDIIQAGDVIIKYWIYDDNTSLTINTSVNRDIYGQMINENTKIFYWTEGSEEKNITNIISTTEFVDRYEVKLALDNSINKKIGPYDTVNLLVEYSMPADNLIPKTAIVPLRRIAENESGYIYLIMKQNSVFGEENYIKKLDVTIKSVGTDMVAVTYSKTQSFPYGEQIKIVNYASAILEDGTKVKVK